MDGAEFSFGLTQELLSQLLRGLQARLTAPAPAPGRRH
jgi:hypothetical protein